MPTSRYRFTDPHRHVEIMPNPHPDDPTPARGSINLAARLEDIETVLEEIRDQMALGARTFAVMGIRLRALEIIVYGGCGLVLVAVLSAVLVLVITNGKADTVVVQPPIPLPKGITP